MEARPSPTAWITVGISRQIGVEAATGGETPNHWTDWVTPSPAA
jgi:hypothetical protein